MAEDVSSFDVPVEPRIVGSFREGLLPSSTRTSRVRERLLLYRWKRRGSWRMDEWCSCAERTGSTVWCRC